MLNLVALLIIIFLATCVGGMVVLLSLFLGSKNRLYSLQEASKNSNLEQPLDLDEPYKLINQKEFLIGLISLAWLVMTFPWIISLRGEIANRELLIVVIAIMAVSLFGYLFGCAISISKKVAKKELKNAD